MRRCRRRCGLLGWGRPLRTLLRVFTDAVSYATSVPDRDRLRWRGVELAAFHAHPHTQYLLDRDTRLGNFPAPAAKARSALPAGLVVAGVVGTFAALCVLGSLPIVALTSLLARSRLSGGWMVEASTAVGTGCVVVAVSCVWLVVRLCGERHGASMFTAVSSQGRTNRVAVAMGPCVAVMAPVRGVGESGPLWPLLTSLGMLCGVLGVAGEVSRRRAATVGPVPRSHQEPAEVFPEHLEGRYAHLKEPFREIARLDAQQRASVRAGIAEGLVVLAARGLITAEEAQRAAEVPLGLLAAEMPSTRVRRKRGGEGP